MNPSASLTAGSPLFTAVHEDPPLVLFFTPEGKVTA